MHSNDQYTHFSTQQVHFLQHALHPWHSLLQIRTDPLEWRTQWVGWLGVTQAAICTWGLAMKGPTASHSASTGTRRLPDRTTVNGWINKKKNKSMFLWLCSIFRGAATEQKQNKKMLEELTAPTSAACVRLAKQQPPQHFTFLWSQFQVWNSKAIPFISQLEWKMGSFGHLGGSRSHSYLLKIKIKTVIWISFWLFRACWKKMFI